MGIPHALLKGSRSIFISLYWLPMLSIVHVCLGGIVFYSFPFILLVCAVLGLLIALNSISPLTVCR